MIGRLSSWKDLDQEVRRCRHCASCYSDGDVCPFCLDRRKDLQCDICGNTAMTSRNRVLLCKQCYVDIQHTFPWEEK